MIQGISGIQIIGIIIAGAIFWQARAMYQDAKFKRQDFVIWALVSFVLLFVSIFPKFIDNSLRYLNISRALDALLVFGVFGAYVLIFQVYVRIQETQREITEVVRKVAIKFEEKKK